MYELCDRCGASQDECNFCLPPYPHCFIKKVHGPYRRKTDGRQHVIIIYHDGSRKTVSYPKYLTEKRLGRYLEPHETVDHEDGNFYNNDPSNIKVISRSRHSYSHARRVKKENFKCPTCEKTFTIGGKRLNDVVQNRKKGKAGPFCGRSCAGKYGKKIELNIIEKLPVHQIKTKHYYLRGSAGNWNTGLV